MDFIKIQQDYEWVLKVLDSCISEQQVQICENVFDIFINKWSEDLSDERKKTFYNNFRKYKSHRILILKKVW